MLDENGATFVLDHLEGYMGMKHRCVPPDTVCNPREEDNVCGPEVGEAFEMDLDEHRRRLEDGRDGGLDGLSGDLADMYIQLGKWSPRRGFGNVGATSSHQAHSPYKTFTTLKFLLAHKWMKFETGECPKGKCGGTVSINGTCVPQNELGNIAAGAILKDAADRGYLWPFQSEEDLFERIHKIGGRRRDNLVAFAIGRSLVSDRGRRVIDREDLSAALSDEYVRNLEANDEIFQVMRGRMTEEDGQGPFDLSDLTTTSQGVDVKECEACRSGEVDSMDSRGYFEDVLMREYAEIYERGARVSIDSWLESRVPRAIGR